MSLSNKIFDKESFYATTYGKEKHLLVKDVRAAVKDVLLIINDLYAQSTKDHTLIFKAYNDIKEIFGERLI